jgi:hypothetical protein
MRPELLRSAADVVPSRPGREFSVPGRQRVDRHVDLDHLAARAHESAANPPDGLEPTPALPGRQLERDPREHALRGGPEVAGRQGSGGAVHRAQL